MKFKDKLKYNTIQQKLAHCTVVFPIILSLHTWHIRMCLKVVYLDDLEPSVALSLLDVRRCADEKLSL